MYSVDFEALKQMAELYGHTGVFYASIPSEGVIEVLFRNGKLTDVHPFPFNGRVWPRWDILLSHLGVLDWELRNIEESSLGSLSSFPDHESSPQTFGSSTSFYPSTGPNTPVPSNRSVIPRTTRQLSQRDLRQLPPACRMVYILVDGRRSIEEIAHVLRKQPNEIAQVIVFLRQNGLLI